MKKVSLRIAFDAKRLTSNRTGLGNYSRFVVEALIKLHPEHQYFLFSSHRGDLSLYENILQSPQVELILPKLRFGASLWRSFVISKELEKYKIDIFHGLSNEIPWGLPRSISSVLTMHDLIYERYPKAYPYIDRKLYHLKYASSCRRADRIIAISQMTKKDIEQFYHIDKQKIAVIYQGYRKLFSEKTLEGTKEIVLQKLQLKKPYLLFVGTLEWRKNMGLIIEALPYIDPQVKAVFVGRETSYSQSMMRRAKDLHIEDRILMPKHLSDEELHILYEGASVMVYPSRFEGFGIPVIEAMACEVPVIAATGSCLEEAGGGFTHYVDPDNPKSLAAEVMEILNNTSIREQMVREGLRHIQKFQPKVIADAIHNLYMHLHQQKRKG